MEPDVGPLPSMDPHDPTSIREHSESPSLLSNSLMAGLSQGGDLERDDEDVNLLHKSAFYGNSERKHRSSAFSSSLTWDSDSEKETFDEEELQHFSNPHGLAAHSPGSPTCEQEQDKPGVYRTPEKPKKIVLDKNLSSSLEAQGQDRDACRDPGMVQSNTQQCVENDKVGRVSDQVGPHFSDTKPKEGYQQEEEEEKEFDQKKKEIKRLPERDVYTFPGDSDPESPPPGPWAHCTFIQRRRKKRALLRPFSGLNPWQCTPSAGRKTRVNPSRTKECSKFVNDKEGVFEFKEEEEEKVQDKKQPQEGGVRGELCQEIFTCVECSIYFKKAAHLREHMREHGQDSGRKGQRGEDNTRRRRAKKSGFECMECGQNFTDRLVLLDHHRRHQESRHKILAEMGKLKEGGTRASRRNSRKPATKESLAICGQFVCLKCNYSSDVPQELADHAKTHTTRTRAGGPRVSPRFQQKSCRRGWTRLSGNAASTTVVSDRYPTRASVQMAGNKPEADHLQAKDCDPQSENKTDLCPGPSQNHTVSSNPAEPTDKPELESAQSEAAPLASPSLQEESGSAEVGLGEENVSKLQSPEPLLTNTKAETQQKDVVFKGTGNRRSKRVVRRVIGRTRASSRLDPQSTDTSDTKIHMQNTEETTELSQKASVPPDPEDDLMLTNKTGVETSALALDVQTIPPPKASEDSKEETNEETPPDSEKDECSKNTTDNNSKFDNNDLDDDDDDDDGGDDQKDNASDKEEDEDDVNHLLDVLTEEEDEEDEEGILLKTVEKKCPYCQDCFDNGIGLANHIRGHLNRVGVSYKVRHFISPEEVNAIEKKFSYQKKKKKVANFDPATFSVMRCEFCSAGFDTRAGLSSHARAHLRDFGITNWEVTASPINVLRELFSKRPDLALSITPAFNSELQDKKPCKEEEESMLVNDEESGTSEPVLQIPASPTQPWRESQNDGEADGGNNKREGDEKMQLQDDSSPRSNSSAAAEETEPKGSSLLKCEVCCALFETRRGLSSHARSHLRQLGVGVSESSGAPIDLLYQLTKERATDSHLPASPPSHSPTPSPKNTHHHAFCVPMPSPSKSTEFEDEPQDIKPLSLLHSVAKSPPSPSSPSPSGLQPSSPFGRSPSPSHSLSASPSPVLRKAPISSLLPVSSLLRSHEHRTMSRSHNSALSTASSRPLWPPQETEAPLNLTMDMDSNTDIICKLCGAWFETRKGLSSHARAHLRHFGVEYSESKGSPIDLLNTLILTDDFKRRATSFRSDSPEDLRVHGHSVAPPSPSTSTPTSASKRPFLSNSVLLKNTTLKSAVGSKATSSSSSSSTHTLLSPPTKKLKPSSQQVFRLSGRELMSIPLAEPMKDVCCEFCGELFENRKGLSSHARSHLRQLGITEWSVNGSPIDTLRDLITRRGLPCVMPLKPLKSSSSSPSPGPPRTLHQHSSPPGGVLGRQAFSFSQHQPAKIAVSAPVTSTSPTVLMVKPKPEPEQVEVTVTGGGREGYSSESLHPSWMSSDNARPINLLMTQEREPSRDIRCEFCGEFFENRKGLSSHARSHLRHMGITEWSVNGSPIDTLWEIMRTQGTTPASVVLGVKEEPGQEDISPWDSQGYQSSRVSPKAPVNLLHSSSRLHKHGFGPTGLSSTPPAGKFLGMKPTGKRVLGTEGHLGQRSLPTQSKTFSAPPQDFSFKGRMSTDKYGVGRMDASCELCGFAFENRKALASHARAHLRQFGVTEWSVNGSPIETLSAWMRSRPQTVAELHRSYLSDGHVAQKKKQSAAQWASLTLSQGRTVERQIMSSSWSSLSRAVEVKNRNGTAFHHGISTQDREQHSSSALPHAQVARSELNVRVTRGIERRPLKHPSHADGGERESCPPKPPRTSTVPALVPKPPSTPLVKLVGKIYSLKCRFCDVEFHGPLSVQEDWIRHLQQHILKLDYNKPAPTATNTPAKSDMAVPEAQASATTSTSITTTATTAPNPTSATSLNPTSVSTPCLPVSTPTPTPTSTPTLTAATLASPGIPAKAEQEVDTPAT
ncbi:protein Wiz isoform X1 [Pangasianodon hypophthalmus]|uniref:protein Wiz isoform X1 n=1 Tax=Pangasianodon hypophthalmus TaxID=310915 RepID=UPI002307E8CE|nr:protein Wiz isoform X1 [Pangasianodon hypophthalmus]XP_026772192.3 protein Wiz isoform X1 [Pangasianodon hypophthalmus]